MSEKSLALCVVSLGPAGKRQQQATALRAWAVLPYRCPALPNSRLFHLRPQPTLRQVSRQQPDLQAFVKLLLLADHPDGDH